MAVPEQDRGYWERHAKGYDLSLRALHRPLPRMCLLAAEAVRNAGRVLEVAAGTGLVTSAIARTARTVVATDYSESMVNTLRERLRREGISNVTSERADIYRLPFPDGSFDAVVAANVLHLVPDLNLALAALRRVLEPHGKLVAPTFLHAETFLARVASRAFAFTGFPAKRQFTAASLRNELESRGVRVARSETLDGLIPVAYVEGTFADEP
jgi:ubiquinone/menaquinone biosynthesis C-methylase UbiE